ncbi:hypothetical protein [Anabaena lutea]|uniref:hypothetical protein n=1 Tax=Anabaena lutea TaxID=212350 RepID=UPI00168789DA|nr:hypothetical protein [Anabaena lutea]
MVGDVLKTLDPPKSSLNKEDKAQYPVHPLILEILIQTDDVNVKCLLMLACWVSFLNPTYD